MRQQRRRVGQVGEEHVGPMFGQLLAAVPSGGDGGGAGADGAAQRTSSGVSPTTQMRPGSAAPFSRRFTSPSASRATSSRSKW